MKIKWYVFIISVFLVGMISLNVDLSRWGIHKVNGFVKQGSRIVVETGVKYGGIRGLAMIGKRVCCTGSRATGV